MVTLEVSLLDTISYTHLEDIHIVACAFLYILCHLNHGCMWQLPAIKHTRARLTFLLFPTGNKGQSRHDLLYLIGFIKNDNFSTSTRPWKATIGRGQQC